MCTRSHFGRMGWDLEVGCDCGAELKNLSHFIQECPILSERRPRFFWFLFERFPGRPSEKVEFGDIVFSPDPEAVGKLGRFLCSGDMIVWNLILLFFLPWCVNVRMTCVPCLSLRQ